MKLEDLRRKYPIFEYKSFDYKIEGEDLICSWIMTAGELNFHPKLIVYGGAVGASKVAKSELDNLVFHVGLADIFSYWKATCSPEIRISAGKLGEHQLAFWHKLLIKGMGQYFYANKINYNSPDFVRMLSEVEASPFTVEISPAGEGVLIPVGGGKDSAVTLELLKTQGRIGSFSMNLAYQENIQPSAERLIDLGGSHKISVHRIMDSTLWDLREEGYLTGHIPFTAYTMFLSTLLAKLFDYSSVAFSNEQSSNEGNIEYLGDQINHQYSKSFEFEMDFDKYNKAYLSNVNIFSFLRPLYELQIMKIFSQPAMDKYYTQFRSCNIGYKTDSWCGSCPKCLSVFVGLFPFMKTETLVSIFDKNLFDDLNLLDLTKNVLGLGVGKPFECIGTYEETVAAFYLSLKKLESQNLPPLLAYFKTQEPILEQKLGNLELLSQNILGSWNDENLVPQKYSAILKTAFQT